MNPDTGRLEALQQRHEEQLTEVSRSSRLREEVSRRLREVQGLPERSQLVRPDGSDVPSHWAIFTAGELVTVKDQTFTVAYMNECTLMLEPVKPEDALAPAARATPPGT